MKRYLIILGIMTFLSLMFAAGTLDLAAPLPVDPGMVVGKLPNGLTYYIKANHIPANRAELRLVVKTGSVQEDDDQRGLAHFTEHMAFNGTKHFKKKELLDYLNSIGMGFQAGLNAYTSKDETVYELKLATDKSEELKKGFLILRDWADGISLDAAEVEKERGVIIEEIRRGLGAWERISKAEDAVLYRGSRYADRDGTGTIEDITNFKLADLKRFYTDWYRPDLQAVVCVGDFDPLVIENHIKEYFTDIPQPVNPRKVVEYAIPVNPAPECIITTDKEASDTAIKFLWKQDAFKLRTIEELKDYTTVDLFSKVLSARLAELTQAANPPYGYAFCSHFNAAKTKAIYRILAWQVNGSIQSGTQVLLTEIERFRRYGVTESELLRAKEMALREAEKELAEKDKTESEKLIGQIVYAITDNGVFMSTEDYVAYTRQLLDEINLEDLNTAGNGLMPNNLLIAASAPLKKDVMVPTEAELLALVDNIRTMDIAPYQDEVNNEPLMAKMPVPGKITKEKVFKKTGIKMWTLSNGAQVYAKQTDNKADEIRFKAVSPGGGSLYPYADRNEAGSASSYALGSGFGNFSVTELTKKMAGKTVEVQFYVGRFAEIAEGNCSPRDMETMFQYIYQYSHAARFDTTSFAAVKAKTRSFYLDSANNPEYCFQDTIYTVMYNRHPFIKQLTVADIDATRLERCKDIFFEQFGDLGDFTFVFVGNFDEKLLKKYCEQYLATTALHPKKDKIKDDGIDYMPGIYNKDLYMGQADKSNVYFVLHEPVKISKRTRTELIWLDALLFEKMNENIRENRGGVYNIQFDSAKYRYPHNVVQSAILMECAPDRVIELSDAVVATMDSLKAGMIAPKYLNTIKQTRMKQMETNLKNNDWWLSRITDQLEFNLPLDDIMQETAMTEKLNLKQMRNITKKYLTHDTNRLRFVLYPESMKTK